MNTPQDLPPQRPPVRKPLPAGQPPAHSPQPVQPFETVAQPAGTPPRKGSALKWIVPLLLLAGLIAGGAIFAKNFMGGAPETAAMQELQELGVIFSKNSKKTHVTTVNLIAIKDPAKFQQALDICGGCSEIKSVDLNQSMVTDADMPKVAKIGSTTSLTLSETAVTDAGLKSIASMRKLETLYLNQTGITNASIPLIAELKSLRILGLSYTKIDGELAPLATLPQLSWLLFEGATINDDSLSAMAECKKLTRLTLRGATVENPESLDTIKIQIDR